MIELYTRRSQQDPAYIKKAIRLRSQIKRRNLLIKLFNQGLERLFTKLRSNTKSASVCQCFRLEKEKNLKKGSLSQCYAQKNEQF